MSTENTGTVEVTIDGDVAVVTLRRERKRNALSTHLEARLLEALRSGAVAGSRAVVITGGDQVFSAGADVTELRDMTPAAIADYYRASGAVYEVLADLPVPTVAAVAGYCLGGGLELALAADFRVADPTADFGFPEVGLGILPSSGGVTRLVRSIGPDRARDLVLRGRRFDPALAERWGLITEIAPAGEHLSPGAGDRQGTGRPAPAGGQSHQSGHRRRRRVLAPHCTAARTARLRRAQPRRLALPTADIGDGVRADKTKTRPREGTGMQRDVVRPNDRREPSREAAWHLVAVHKAVHAAAWPAHPDR